MRRGSSVWGWGRRRRGRSVRRRGEEEEGQKCEGVGEEKERSDIKFFRKCQSHFIRGLIRNSKPAPKILPCLLKDSQNEIQSRQISSLKEEEGVVESAGGFPLSNLQNKFYFTKSEITMSLPMTILCLSSWNYPPPRPSHYPPPYPPPPHLGFPLHEKQS